jgi:uncharacterized repeat protein (TIGR02543 family)
MWETNIYTVIYNSNDGSGETEQSSHGYDEDSYLKKNSFDRVGYNFVGWNTQSDGNGVSYLDEAGVRNLVSSYNGSLTLYAQWTPITYKVFPTDVYGTMGGLEPIYCTYDVPFSISWSNTFTGESGNFNFKGWYTDSSCTTLLSSSANATLINLTTVDGATVYVYANAAVKDNSCFTGDTLVTLMDGSSTTLESLEAGDIIMSWNAITGEFEAMPISLFWNHGESIYDIISLTFSNEKTLKVVTEHGFFDATLNKYVYIDASNYSNYIGHEFSCLSENGVFENVTLIAANYKKEMSSCYSLRTACNDNAIVDGFLTLTHEDIPGFLTYFEFGDGYMYDEVKMQEDIEKYGLYTYDDWKEYVTYEEFVAFNGQYLTIVIGKGYLTYEDVLSLIEGMR